MHNRLVTAYLKSQNMTNCEQGENLVEFALLIAMLALAVIIGVSQIAALVKQLFASTTA
jgi:Flp pilus assembly pilin Flp